MMIRQEIKDFLEKLFPDEKIVIDYVPKGKKGDYSTNLAFKIAVKRGTTPQKVAQEIADRIKDPMISDVTVYEPGFINLTIRTGYLLEKLFEQEAKIDLGKKKRILIEYVSVNPTGPINVVNARAAAVGDSLVRLLNKTGFLADAEYYVNDGGRQIDLLTESVRQRIMELNGKKAQIPKNGYHGEYLVDLAKEIQDKGIENNIKEIKKYTIDYFIEEHKRTLAHFSIKFDNWISESKIYEKGYVEKVLNIFKEKNLVYEKDSALWFKTTEFGDSDDRVIITSDGRYTYLLTDIAYHHYKIMRNYDKLINIWGPDHHGRIKGLIGGVRALNYPEDIIKVIIVQEVKLKKQREIVTMSKRAGTFEKLDDLLNQVPKDVVRFFLLMRSNSQHLDFDLELALKESDENPVYYVQYAHARIKSIIRKAKEEGIKLTDKFAPHLIKEEEIALVKTVLKFPEILEDAVNNFEPYIITYYLIELARTFHHFYQKLRVISDNKNLTQMRLTLINKTAKTIKKGLDILGVSCPEKM